MRTLFKKLMRDQQGMILSSEVVLIGTILVLGSIVGLTAVSHAVTGELNDIANAYQANSAFQNSNAQGGTTNTNYYTVADSEGIPEMAGY